MAYSWVQVLFVLCIAIVFPSGALASNFDAGDALALILGLVIGVLGICACIGCYARKQTVGMD